MAVALPVVALFAAGGGDHDDGSGTQTADPYNRGLGQRLQERKARFGPAA